MSAVVTILEGCSVVLDVIVGRAVCDVSKSVVAMEEGVWEISDGFTGVVSGVTVSCSVVISLEGVVFMVRAEVFIEARSNVATKMVVLMKKKMATIYCILRVLASNYICVCARSEMKFSTYITY